MTVAEPAWPFTGARATAANIGLAHGRGLLFHFAQRIVHPDADRALRVARRHEVFQADRAEQVLAVAVGASHRLRPAGLQSARSSLILQWVRIGISTAWWAAVFGRSWLGPTLVAMVDQCCTNAMFDGVFWN